MVGKLRHSERLGISGWPSSSSAKTLLEHRQHRRVSPSRSKPKLRQVCSSVSITQVRAVGLVLVAVRERCTPSRRLAEEILEGVERLGRAEPGELVRPQVDARLEMLLVLLADPRVDAVGDHDQVGVGELLQAFHLALEAHLHAELAAAVLQDVEQRHARAAAEAVAARAHHLALVDHVDVAPVGEAAADALVGDAGRTP